MNINNHNIHDIYTAYVYAYVYIYVYVNVYVYVYVHYMYMYMYIICVCICVCTVCICTLYKYYRSISGISPEYYSSAVLTATRQHVKTTGLNETDFADRLPLHVAHGLTCFPTYLSL